MAIEQSSMRGWPYASDDEEAVDQLTIRAITEYMTVLDVTEDIYQVVTQSGSAYRVDLRHPACTCPDFQRRGAEIECKHIRRVKLKTDTTTLNSIQARLQYATEQRQRELTRLESATRDLRSTIKTYKQALDGIETL